MPKLVTVHRHDEITRQAHDYVKSYILFPSGLLGLVSMIGGVGALGYQLLATDGYTWVTFYQSSGLILLGVVVGWYKQRIINIFCAAFPTSLPPGCARRPSRRAGKQAAIPAR